MVLAINNNMNTNTVADTSTLPVQSKVDAFLKDHFTRYFQDTFYISTLTERVIQHFKIAPEVVQLRAEIAHEIGGGECGSTLIEQRVHWGCVHLLNASLIKRTGTNEYQHISGVKPPWKVTRVSQKLIGEAMVSVNILRNLNWEPERIMVELHQWPDNVIEAAIQKVFGNV